LYKTPDDIAEGITSVNAYSRNGIRTLGVLYSGCGRMLGVLGGKWGRGE